MPQINPVAVLHRSATNPLVRVDVPDWHRRCLAAGFPAPRPFRPDLDQGEALRHGVLDVDGVIVGGRLGYVLFYDLPACIANPTLIFEVWKGGMAFHGRFVGVMIAAWWFGRRNGRVVLPVDGLRRAVRADWPGCRAHRQLHPAELWEQAD